MAAQCGVNMAIHQDDPCWSIFGLPRIITDEKNLDRFLKLVDDPHNGLTLCCGSLGCSAKNDVPALGRQVRQDGAHPLCAPAQRGGAAQRLRGARPPEPLRLAGHVRHRQGPGGKTALTATSAPDHGRMIWGETGRAGYGLYDRALGAAYLNGLFEAAEKEAAQK